MNEGGMRTVRPEESGASAGVDLCIAKTSRGISDRVGEAYVERTPLGAG